MKYGTPRALLPLAICLAIVRTGLAAPPAVAGGATDAPVATAPPPPYALPWQLRPIAAGTVVRSDSSLAFYENPDGDAGSTLASTLLASYKVTPSLAPLVRVAMVRNQEPGPAVGGGAAFVNPVVGLIYGATLRVDLRGSAFLGAAIPVGQSGDKAAGTDAGAAAVARGIAARSAMDNAMFAVNYFTAIGGLDVAYVAHKLTVQAEATLLQLFRTRNEAFAPDANRTNLTTGLHAGYFLVPALSLGGELRYQRWLSTPKAVSANPASRDTITVAIGPRVHFKAGGLWVRPGLAYATALDDPIKYLGYHIVQVDVPVIF